VWRSLLLLLVGCGRLHFGSGGASDGGDDPTGDGRSSDGRPPALVNNPVFVVQVTDIGALGLAGADAACQAAADNAPLPGVYRAWLSTNTVNAVDRLAGARGWVRPDGTPFADTVTDIVTGKALSPITVEANGAFSPLSYVASGTLGNGTTSGQTCNDWTSTTGQSSGGTTTATSTYFTDNQVTGGACGGTAGIYCFGIDRNEPMVITPATGRIAFVSTPWAPGGGLSDADAHCQADAASHGLTETFVAALAGTASSDPKQRLNTAGMPWVRLDGIPLAATAVDTFASASSRIAPLNLDIDRMYIGADLVWTGFRTLTPTSCNDWIQTGGGQTGAATNGAYELLFDLFGLGAPIPCNTAQRLYCFEQ